MMERWPRVAGGYQEPKLDSRAAGTKTKVKGLCENKKDEGGPDLFCSALAERLRTIPTPLHFSRSTPGPPTQTGCVHNRVDLRARSRPTAKPPIPAGLLYSPPAPQLLARCSHRHRSGRPLISDLCILVLCRLSAILPMRKLYTCSIIRVSVSVTCILFDVYMKETS
ncbi:hypothetical protein NDU88_004554 [Pleurodeles waltl]|uniref:Uncharacterized protein n=1 Tax=Pleurodeles waltl TaxID=8319 RepID=A0AAV7TRL6_PLEWA|nr:hypothetical protein NDU88_004554 [Pleurodeles waltl]